MTLKEYLSSFENNDSAARFLHIKSRTIGSWKRGERLPRPAQARYLIEMSGGALTFSGIYGQTEDVNLEKKDLLPNSSAIFTFEALEQ